MKPYALWLILALPGSASAQVADNWITLGMRDSTCAEWTKEKVTGEWTYVTKRSWISGVISGYNAAKGGNIASTTNGAGISGWMDRYCADHPLDNISTAARRLLEELDSRQGY